jgi:anti-anti-sigma factor
MMPAPDWLTISVSPTTDGVQVVHLHGEVDMATVPQLTDALTATIRSGGTADILIDLTALTFLAADGLTAFIQAYELAELSGRTLRARNSSGEVDTVLRITSVAELLQIPDVPVAVSDIDGSQAPERMIP